MDIVRFNGMPIAVLDTSATAHMPDVLEMPCTGRMIVGAGGGPAEALHTYRLGGMSCLAGDVIGDYSFDRPLEIGDRLVFLDMAHYTMVKTTAFNGVRLPAIATHDPATGRITVHRRFGYRDYRDRLVVGDRRAHRSSRSSRVVRRRPHRSFRSRPWARPVPRLLLPRPALLRPARRIHRQLSADTGMFCRRSNTRASALGRPRTRGRRRQLIACADDHVRRPVAVVLDRLTPTRPVRSSPIPTPAAGDRPFGLPGLR